MLSRFFIDRPIFAWVIAIVIMLAGVALPMGPLAGYFRMQPLPLGYWPCLVLLLVGYAALTTVLKKIYIRRYGW